jgi:rod shape determining protein RodA
MINAMNNQRIYIHDTPQPFFHKFYLDRVLFSLTLILVLIGMLILFSASHQNIAILMRQALYFLIGFSVLILLAQIPPQKYYRFIPLLFLISFCLLVSVLLIGHIGKGAKRWFNLGFFHFQPSELMKVILPLTLAWYLGNKPSPLSLKTIFVSFCLIGMTGGLIAKQPDLGTSIIVIASGLFVLFLAGLSWQIILGLIASFLALSPVIWYFMHPYQKSRVFTLLNPESDPLGKGYHIIQSKIAIGSGGVFGKGLLSGSQSHLQFLPEHKTDFIFAVCSEEFGLLGNLVILALLAGISGRGIYISLQVKDTFSRLLAGSLSLSFFLSFTVNIGMVAGMLPVVGVPLPLVSYGGSSIVITMMLLGILMSIQKDKRLISS